MFKKLADRLHSAVSSVTNSTPSPVQRLEDMGFSQSEAQHALQVSGGNVERAAEWLLLHAPTSTDNNNNHSGPTSQLSGIASDNDEEDQALQEALAASLEANPTRMTSTQPTTTRSAASRRAGQAALTRFETSNVNEDNKKKAKNKEGPSSSNIISPPATTTLSSSQILAKHHPNVQVPKRLSQHDKEDQILRCADRIAPHPRAVDTLLKSLKRLQENPTDSRLRSIDTTTLGFQKSLQAPGVLDYLKAMNYHPSYSNRNILELSMYDAATLYLGISALEQIRLTSKEYQHNKQRMLFDEEIQKLLHQADTDTEEAIRRANYMSKCPSEPTNGGGLLQIELGSQKVSRKFEGDDTLQDILSFLGGHASSIPDKLRNGEWFLVDQNLADSPPYNIASLESKTIQYIGMWPSARLAVVPFDPSSSLSSKSRSSSPTNSRALGAAPIDYLT